MIQVVHNSGFVALGVTSFIIQILVGTIYRNLYLTLCATGLGIDIAGNSISTFLIQLK